MNNSSITLFLGLEKDQLIFGLGCLVGVLVERLNLNSKYLSQIILFVIFLSLSGCDYIGDFIVMKIHFSNTNIKINEFEKTLPPGKTESSDNCIRRWPRFDARRSLLICHSQKLNMIILTQQFPYQYKLIEKGITKDVLESEEYSELIDVSKKVEELLKTKKFKYTVDKFAVLSYSELYDELPSYGLSVPGWVKEGK